MIFVASVVLGFVAFVVWLVATCIRETRFPPKNKRVNLPPPSRDCARKWRVAEPN